MLRNRIINLFIFCLCFIVSSNAQTAQMTLEQAVELCLKNNYDIIISKNSLTQVENNNTPGNAGMLPRVDLNASGSFATNATKQEFSSGLVVDKPGVQSKNISTGAYLTWTVFDGFKMFATREKLQDLQSMGELNVKIQIENTIVKVISAYYTIVIQKQLINGFKENIAVSEERLKIAQTKFEVGASPKGDVLQAKIDLNALKSGLMRQKTLLFSAKTDLNQLMIRPVDTDFDVSDSIPLMKKYLFEELKNSILTNNSEMLFAQKNIEVSKAAVNEGKAINYPKLNLNSNYIFSRSQNQAGFSLLNQNLGLNLGFTASWNVFNGFNNANIIKNLQLDLENSNYEYESLKTLTQAGLVKAFQKYQDDNAILQLEEENKLLVKENLDVALERFRLGASTSLELKVAQQSFEDSINRLADARFNLKISETQLLKLSGGIMK